jgi:hypothetical protein
MPAKVIYSPAEQEKLVKVAEHVAPKSDLKISVEGRFDPEADQAALKEQKLVRLIDSRRKAADAVAAAAGTSTLQTILESLFVEQFSAEALETERLRLKPAPSNAAQAQIEGAVPPGFDAAAFYEGLRARLLEAQVVAESDLAAVASARTTALVEALNKSGSIEPARAIAAPPGTVKKKKAGSTRVASEVVMTADGDSEDND